MTDGHRPNLRLLDYSVPSARTRSQGAHPTRGRRVVLYVSGDHEARSLFTRVASRWEQVTLLVADSGEEGLDLAIARHTSMVVLDAHHSDFDGEKLVKALRERVMTWSEPIMVLSHDASPGEWARFIWAGASAYITKPLNVAEIDRAVGELLGVAAIR